MPRARPRRGAPAAARAAPAAAGARCARAARARRHRRAGRGAERARAAARRIGTRRRGAAAASPAPDASAPRRPALRRARIATGADLRQRSTGPSPVALLDRVRLQRVARPAGTSSRRRPSAPRDPAIDQPVRGARHAPRRAAGGTRPRPRVHGARARGRDRRDVVGLPPRPDQRVPARPAPHSRPATPSRRGSRGPFGGVVVSARITIGASSPLAPCTVITRTSSRAMSMSRFTCVSPARSQATKPCSVGASCRS